MYERCYCPDRDESMRLLAGAMVSALTDYYAVYRQTVNIKFLFWTIPTVITRKVYVPKEYEDDYLEKKINFMKESITAFEEGYSNSLLTEEAVDRFRKKVAEYQMAKNEVWE